MATAVVVRNKLLTVALHTLNASCLERQQPAHADEVYLRQISGGHTTSIEELARQIIQSELRLRKGAADVAKNKLEP